MGSTVNLVEIFSSVQGEGPHVGGSTLFVRLGECDLRCRWCDSPHTWQPAEAARLETARGTGRFRSVPNPVPVADAVEAARALEISAHRFASLTGGEPLLQPEAVRALAEALRALGPRVLLESHGAAPEALERVVDAVDVVSMDWKLASDVRRASDPRHGPVAAFHDVHERFLAVAQRAPEVVVKVVVTPDTQDAELEEMARRVCRAGRPPTVVVQPVTPFGRVRETVAPERLLAVTAGLETRLPDVRLIPQTHRSYGAP